MVILASFWKPTTCGHAVLPDRSILVRQNWKIQMRHFVWFSNTVWSSKGPPKSPIMPQKLWRTWNSKNSFIFDTYNSWLSSTWITCITGFEPKMKGTGFFGDDVITLKAYFCLVLSLEVNYSKTDFSTFLPFLLHYWYNDQSQFAFSWRLSTKVKEGRIKKDKMRLHAYLESIEP